MSASLPQAYIVAATRTPVGKAPRGALRSVRPDDLLVQALRGVWAQVPTVDPALIDDVVVGCAMPEAEQGLNVARIAALLAGWPAGVGGITINRFCASGLNAVAMAADRIRVGAADLMVAAGVESMSRVPMMGHVPAINPQVLAQPEHWGIAYGMGLTAEKVAQRWKVSRPDQDAYAWASHQRALAAQAAGEWAAEITPVTVTQHQPDLMQGQVLEQTLTFQQDEGPRPDTSLDSLARLRPVFAARGSVTAGNSSQMSDGAAALVLMSERMLKQTGVRPLARFASFAVRGVAPEVMGIGPVAAVPVALQQAGITAAQLDWIELNEAFAAQTLAVMRELRFDPDRVNPLGGAIALGHPLGATGALRSVTVVHALQRRVLRYGMVTMCVGTGMGAAGVFEGM